MCYAQTHPSNGRLPRVAVLCAFGGRRNVMIAKKLVEVGLWIANDDGSWTIWNYVGKNQTAEEIAARREAGRAANAARQQAARDRRNARVTESNARDVALRSVTVTGLPPEPSLPPPLQPSDQISEHAAPVAPPTDPVTKTRSRGSRLPVDWTPSAEAQAWAKTQGVADPLGSILDDFRDYWAGIPGARGVKLDWDATYRNRVRQVAARPSASRFAARGAEITKQPPAYDAPWMKLPEVG